MNQPRSSRLLRGVSWNLGGQGAALAVNFLILPALIAALGLEGYGLYVMMQAAVNSISILSLGSGSAVTKFVAEQGRSPGTARDALRYGALMHGGGALVGALVLAAFAGPAARQVFSVAEAQREEAVFLLRCAAAAAVPGLVTLWAYSALQGLQRFDWQNALAAAAAIVLPVGSLAVLKLGGGLSGVGVWYAAGSALTAAAAAWAALSLRPRGEGGALEPGRFVRYALGMALGPVAWMATFQVDRFLIAARLPMQDLGLYAAPAGVLQRLQVLPAAIASVLVPMMSESDDNDLPRFYLRTLRLLLFLTLPGLAVLWALLPPLLTLWLGPEFAGRSAQVGRLLVLGQAGLVLAYVPNALAAGRGRPLMLSGLAWAQAALSVALWLVLVGRWGIVGVAAGAAAGQALPALFYLPWAGRRLISLGGWKTLWSGVGPPALAALVAAAALLPLRGRVHDWGALLAAGAWGGAVFLAASWLLAPEEDRKSVRELARAL